MSNEKVIIEFLEGKQAHTPTRNIQNGCYTYQGQTLYTEGNKLINYNTIIAIKENNDIYLNINKYSRTTSKIQSKIRQLATEKQLNIIELTNQNN